MNGFKLSVGKTPKRTINDIRLGCDCKLLFHDRDPYSLDTAIGCMTAASKTLPLEGIMKYHDMKGALVGGAVGLVIYRSKKGEKEFLVNTRSDYSSHAPGSDSLITGKAECFQINGFVVPEEPLAAAFRELTEETGLRYSHVLEVRQLPPVKGGWYPADASGKPLSPKSLPLYVDTFAFEVRPNALTQKSGESVELRWEPESQFYKTFERKNTEPFSRQMASLLGPGLRGHRLGYAELGALS